MTTATPDLAGWDTRLTELSTGLDLILDDDLRTLVTRIERAIPAPERVATLRALRSWLGSTRRSRGAANLAVDVALAWRDEQTRRAAAAARKASGANPFARLPETDEDAF